MTSLPEQFAAARKALASAPFTAGFDFFHSLANQAVESAGRVAALNLSTSRDSLERSARTAQALLRSRDPRDVLMLGGHAEEQVRSLFAYSRELMDIAGGIRPYALPVSPLGARSDIETVAFKVVTPAPQAAAEPASAAPVPAPAEEPTIDTQAFPAEAAAPAAPATPEPVDSATAPQAASAEPNEPVVVAEPEPAVELIVSATDTEPGPVAEPKAIAKAVGKGMARAAVAPHPAAAPVAAIDDVELPKIEVPAAASAPSSRRKK